MSLEQILPDLEKESWGCRSFTKPVSNQNNQESFESNKNEHESQYCDLQMIKLSKRDPVSWIEESGQKEKGSGKKVFLRALEECDSKQDGAE